jgi:hypothetical protein
LGKGSFVLSYSMEPQPRHVILVYNNSLII